MMKFASVAVMTLSLLLGRSTSDRVFYVSEEHYYKSIKVNLGDYIVIKSRGEISVQTDVKEEDLEHTSKRIFKVVRTTVVYVTHLDQNRAAAVHIMIKR